jgi:hypothetical protein
MEMMHKIRDTQAGQRDSRTPAQPGPGKHAYKEYLILVLDLQVTNMRQANGTSDSIRSGAIVITPRLGSNHSCRHPCMAVATMACC